MTTEFRNEPLTDFSREEHAVAMRSAIEKVKRELGLPDVPGVGSGLDRPYPAHQAFIGDFHEPLGLAGDFADTVHPARIAVLVAILRGHLVQMQSVRISNEAKTDKMAQLYAFITSVLVTSPLVGGTPSAWLS